MKLWKIPSKDIFFPFPWSSHVKNPILKPLLGADKAYLAFKKRSQQKILSVDETLLFFFKVAILTYSEVLCFRRHSPWTALIGSAVDRSNLPLNVRHWVGRAITNCFLFSFVCCLWGFGLEFFLSWKKLLYLMLLDFQILHRRSEHA